MIRSIATVLALSLFAVPSWADEAATCDKACPKECASGTCAGAACPIETAMAKLPKLSYLVGEQATCCAEAAATLAKEHNATVKYVLCEKTYETQAEAMVALADATEKFVNDFATPAKCEVSGKVTVAGKELCCDTMASQRAEVAKKAMDQVAVTYLVGDKECACPNQAATLAKESGKEQLFVVAGEKTCCAIDARLKVARAKYRAAVEALAKADAPAQEPEQQAAVTLQ
jgi:hypothetical protein